MDVVRVRSTTEDVSEEVANVFQVDTVFINIGIELKVFTRSCEG